MSDQEREKVVVPYADLQKEIEIVLLSRPQDNFHVKALQTTLCSMEPMVYDLDECVKGSPCHKNIEEFLSLVKEANKFISSNKNKLQTTRIKLKDLFKKHVEMELDAAGSIEVADGQVEMELQRLVSYLGFTIRLKLADDTSKLPVLRNIDIILDNLKQDSGGKEAQLLKLLNQVKVLLKFLKGDHDIEIPKLLLNYEKWLRKDFVTEEGLSELKKLDQEDKEKTIRELQGFFFIFGLIAFAYAYQTQSLIAFFIGAGCLFFAYNFGDESSSNSTISKKTIRELQGFFYIFGVIAFVYAYQNQSLIAFFVGAGCFTFAHNFEDESSSNFTISKKTIRELLGFFFTVGGIAFAYYAYQNKSLIAFFIGVGCFISAYNFGDESSSNSTNSKKTTRELQGYFFIFGAIAFAYAYQNKSLIAFFIGAGCFIIAYNFGDESSSNSTISSYQKNLKERKKYDIFLNFRGDDQRKGFAGILHYSLEKENISTFFDVTSIPKSKVFWEEIRKGINNSIGAITIFSEGYTESVDCLDELVLISDRGKESETYKITPVFYDIPTTDLEPESESKFRADLKNHDKEDKLVQWEAAITHVASINGHTYNSKSLEMYKLVDAIVEDYKKYV